MLFQLKPVLEEIESRSSKKEYVQILDECHKLYCEQRLSLVSWWLNVFIKCILLVLAGHYALTTCSIFYVSQVKGIVQQRISEFSKKEALPSLTRSGCAYLMQVTLITFEYMLVVFKPGPSSFVTWNWKHLWKKCYKECQEQISQKEKA